MLVSLSCGTVVGSTTGAVCIGQYGKDDQSKTLLEYHNRGNHWSLISTSNIHNPPWTYELSPSHAPSSRDIVCHTPPLVLPRQTSHLHLSASRRLASPCASQLQQLQPAWPACPASVCLCRCLANTYGVQLPDTTFPLSSSSISMYDAPSDCSYNSKCRSSHQSMGVADVQTHPMYPRNKGDKKTERKRCHLS